MKSIVVGLGTQGKKRIAVAGKDCVATVDPFNPDAKYKKVEEVPLDLFEAAQVCTPDLEKMAILRYLIQNRKHILVEKPLVSAKPSDLMELGQMAAKNGVKIYTAYNHRFDPAIAKLKKVIDSGELGQVYLAKFYYGNGTARDVRNSAWKDQGSGVLGDLGCHMLDLAQMFFVDRPTKWNARGLYRFENRAHDHVLFSCEGSKPVLHFEASLLAWKNSFTINLFAEKGSAHIDGLTKWGPSRLTVRHRVLPSGRPPEEVFEVSCPDPTWALEYAHFVALPDSYQSIDQDLWIQESLDSIEQQYQA